MSDEVGRMARVLAAARMVLRCDDDARAEGRYGLLDCVDNSGRHYPSEYLGRALDTLRAELKPAEIPNTPASVQQDEESKA